MQNQTTTATPTPSAARATVGPLTWRVPSATRPGHTYEVVADPADGRLICCCPARRGTCWHVRAIASGAMGKPRVRFQPKPAPAPRLSLPCDDLYPADAPAIPLNLPREW